MKEAIIKEIRREDNTKQKDNKDNKEQDNGVKKKRNRINKEKLILVMRPISNVRLKVM
jgi:bacterial translation initiation factor 2 (bIF-2)